MSKKTAVIIGAGPAGLTAALELLERSDIHPIVLEATTDIGGISKTVNYKGNRIDIGGHRFFSKSDRVMSWWMKILPVQGSPSRDEIQLKLDTDKKYAATKSGPNPQDTDRVMLLRGRISRIFFLRSFFDYPVSLSLQTISNLGLVRMAKIGISYFWSILFPIRQIRSLEDFFINRFGRELYLTFFKDYTEKVWGVPCHAIKPEWGAQRIKGLSILKTLLHAFKKILPARQKDLKQSTTETSLIEQFMYPKLGPGQLWEEVARQVQEKGGEVILDQKVMSLTKNQGQITQVETTDSQGNKRIFTGDIFFSTMPIKDLVQAIQESVPQHLRVIASNLVYRDFLTVGLLLKKMKIKNETNIPTVNNIVPDNWIYIQEREVRLGRLQVFNNWSPYLVADSENVWIGLEYFCNEGDDLWSKSREQMITFAIDELASIDIINKEDVLDGTLLRVPKAYPAYFGSYDQFGEVREYLDTIENLYLVGRNGMHRYNNADHSMLTAMVAVDNILKGVKDKSNIWAVNTEEDYHETKS